MFTGKSQKNRTVATTYFDEHLSHNDYYTEKETQAGYWVGQGVQLLGLKPGEVVTREAFLRLCDNVRPVEGAKLTQVHAGGRRIFFDFQCAPPKSVSIVGVMMQDTRILQAHREAAAIAIKELESFAAVRVRKNGAMDDRLTGKLVGASFLHTSSRALDPHLHTHFTLFNATFDPVEQRWKALQTSGMYDAIHYGTAVYRNELAKRLHGLGYRTRPTAKGSFEIEGVEPKLIALFSKRSKQRDAAVAAAEKRLGRKLSKNEVSFLVHRSRPGKRKDISEADVRKAQLDELGFFEKRALRALVAQARAQKVAVVKEAPAESVAHALDHVFARQSVAAEHELWEAALIKGCGRLDLQEVKAAFQADDRLVRAGREISTKEILQAELKLIRAVNDGLNAAEPLAPQFQPSAKLGADQRAALKLVLSSCDRVSGFRGLAGTGKTTTLKELHRAVAETGLAPVFCAPTAAATEVLRKDGFKEAMTLAKFLNGAPESFSRRVVVLDEAGFVGVEDMTKLLQWARKNEARVVLVGDTGQHTPVAQGDALRLIEQHSGYRFGQLTQIRRQRDKDLREIVALAARQKTAEAFQRLDQSGQVVEAGDDLYQKAAAAYLRADAEGKQALMVSPTWDEIEAVTIEVRDALKKEGRLATKEEAVEVFDPLGWTEAEKRLVESYEPGLRLRFVRQTADFKPGESVEVIEHRGRELRIQRADGRFVTFAPARAAAAFEVGQAREIKLASGDVLLLRANAKNFFNGERVTVDSVHGGRIRLVDGRELPREYRAFTHGYAVTSHAAQGRTVDQVFVVASSRSFAAVSQEQFYVSISRARERATVFTDDKELLGRRVEDAHTRKAAVELQGLREALAKAGYSRTQETRRAENLGAQRETQFPRVQGQRPWRTWRMGRATRLAPQWLQAAALALRRALGIAQADQREEAFIQRAAQIRRQMPLPQQRINPRQSRGMRP